ncbi:rhomboid-like protein [Gordonia rhizosphera]|uniref:rhomboid-like protein n=1 Tax=Gordonia rhizosphera TaxID=83341 RepID=UPI00068EF4D6|nr:rhomboid-like protein [Gordonia rhizosphera]
MIHQLGRSCRSATAAAWRFVRSAPLTFAWLVVLLVTTVIAHSLDSDDLDRVLGERSTNLHHLASDPLHVLLTSLFWIDGSFWLSYLLMFLVFHVPAERWLGSARWLLVGLSAHVVATYVSEGLLGLAIRDGAVGTSMVNVTDVGVSYFLAAIVGVLTYRIAYPWRWLYLAGILVVYGVPIVGNLTFTGIGHLTSLLIGLAWYPITRRRPAPPWNPMDTVRRLGRRREVAEAGGQEPGASVRQRNS